MAGIRSMDDLSLHTLKDVYYAERQTLKALPKMAKAAGHKEVAQLFQETPDEEKQADMLLKDIANKQINQAAAKAT